MSEQSRNSELTKNEKWLKDAGYEYHCFISWPHVGKEAKEWAKKLKESIEQSLKYHLIYPRVFFDDKDIYLGNDWQESLRQALWKSVTLVAIWVPIYANHHWCVREWTANITE